jgi:3-dehydroquinate synthase
MRRDLVPILVITLALAVPVIPFLAFGTRLEAWLDETVHGTADPVTAALLVVGLLSTDVLLPIPSSVLSTLGGEVLGFGAGTAASFLGLTVGAVAGFGLARVAGRPLMMRLTSPEDVARIDRLSRRLGATVLIITRPIPMFAEAAVLFFGTTGLGWRRFLVPVALTNLVIAAAYSALGAWVHLSVALAFSIAFPVLATWIARRVMRAAN